MVIKKKGFKEFGGSYSVVFLKAEIESKSFEHFTISFKENVGSNCSEKSKEDLIKRFKSYAEKIEKVFIKEKEKEMNAMIKKMEEELKGQNENALETKQKG